MTDSLLKLIEKIPVTADAEMDSFINLLWDQDMDMGVHRHFYDPALREQQMKKQEAEQNRLLELKKKYAQQEMHNFIIDEETGERIPNPSAGPFQQPSAFTEDTDLNKELAELADLDYLLGEGQMPNPESESNQIQQNNIPTIQAQQMNFSNCNMIIQTADHPSIPSDLDMWPTEITMVSGPSPDKLQDKSYDTDMFMSQMWGVDAVADAKSPMPGFYGASPDTMDIAPQYQNYNDTDTSDRYQNFNDTDTSDRYHTTASPSAYFSPPNSDSGVSVQDSFLDVFENDNNCTFSSHAYNEDVKPHFLFTANSSGSHGSHMGSTNSSSYSSSENGDNSGSMSQSEQERERRTACRDEMRCKELDIPFSVEVITNYPVEEFNSLLRQHRLTEEQLSLVKDIRRRGKNKVAAQNCRKKKMNELSGLETEIHDLKRKRTELVRDKDEFKRSKLHLRKQLDQTYAEVFNSIRDHLGRPYDPHFYTLHISDDGDARIIPNKVSTYALLNYHQTA